MATIVIYVYLSVLSLSLLMSLSLLTMIPRSVNWNPNQNPHKSIRITIKKTGQLIHHAGQFILSVATHGYYASTV